MRKDAAWAPEKSEKETLPMLTSGAIHRFV